jgi:hypothetical protein
MVGDGGGLVYTPSLTSLPLACASIFATQIPTEFT